MGLFNSKPKKTATVEKNAQSVLFPGERPRLIVRSGNKNLFCPNQRLQSVPEPPRTGTPSPEEEDPDIIILDTTATLVPVDGKIVHKLEYVHGRSFEGGHGEQLGEKYFILGTIGRGCFSTVYRVWNAAEGRLEALKAINCRFKDVEAYYKKECQLLRILKEGDMSHPGYYSVLHMHSNFLHANHYCFTFELALIDLQCMLKQYACGFPVETVKRITRQVLVALKYINSCGIMHTDIKPENILVEMTEKDRRNIVSELLENYDKGEPLKEQKVESTFPIGRTRQSRRNSTRLPPSILEEMKAAFNINDDEVNQSGVPVLERNLVENINIKLADIGCGVFLNEREKPKYKYIQTIQYRAPEIVCGLPWDAKADIWSVGAVSFELATGSLLFDTRQHEDYSEDSHLLSLMLAMLGDFPDEMKKNGENSAEYFDLEGKLVDFPNVRACNYPLLHKIRRNVHWKEEEIRSFNEFLHGMLRYDSKKRLSTDEALEHPFLQQTTQSFSVGIKRKADWELPSLPAPKRASLL